MYSFALYELGIETEEQVREMTWREFQLKRMGYIRQQKEEWKRARLTAYYALVATGAVDTRKMTIEKFLPLEENSRKGKVSKRALDLLRKAQEDYLNGSGTKG